MHNPNLAIDPFFLVYDSRSGSTMLANLMIRHLGVVVPPEVRFVVPVIKKFASREDSSILMDRALDTMYRDAKFQDWEIGRPMLTDRLQSISPLTAARVISEACAIYRDARFPTCSVFGFKKGEYIHRRRLVKSCFPNAKFVAIVRDGRAIFNSKKTSLYSATGKPFETSAIRAAEAWVQFCSELEAAKREYPGEVITVNYEELVENQTVQLQKISEFLGVRFQSGGRGQHQVADRYKGLHENVQKQPMLERISGWRTQLAESEIAEFESIAYDELIGQGYEPVSARPELNPAIKSARTVKRLLKQLSNFIVGRI